MSKRYTEKELNSIAKMLEKGQSYSEITKKTGASSSTIRRVKNLIETEKILENEVKAVKEEKAVDVTRTYSTIYKMEQVGNNVTLGLNRFNNLLAAWSLELVLIASPIPSLIHVYTYAESRYDIFIAIVLASVSEVLAYVLSKRLFNSFEVSMYGEGQDKQRANIAFKFYGLFLAMVYGIILYLSSIDNWEHGLFVLITIISYFSYAVSVFEQKK